MRVDERRGDGVTPLMAASEQGNLEVVQELLDQHANLDLQDQVRECGMEREGRGGREERKRKGGEQLREGSTYVLRRHPQLPVTTLIGPSL